MPKVICDTSPLQYLHQVALLHILPSLTDGVIVPPEVINELETGRRLGIDLPDLADADWLTVQSPVSSPALPL